jgi:hypothetical protein
MNEQQPADAPNPQTDAGKAPDFDTILFAGCEEQAVSFGLLEETYQQAKALIEENGWAETEGLLIIFANGLAFLKGEKAINAVKAGEADPREEMERITRLYMEIDGQYSVMKFRAYKLSQDKRILELNVTGLRGENVAFRMRNQMFRADEERLRARLADLEAENRRLREELDHLRPAASDAEPASPPGVLAAIRSWLLGGGAKVGRRHRPLGTGLSSRKR